MRTKPLLKGWLNNLLSAIDYIFRPLNKIFEEADKEMQKLSPEDRAILQAHMMEQQLGYRNFF